MLYFQDGTYPSYNNYLGCHCYQRYFVVWRHRQCFVRGHFLSFEGCLTVHLPHEIKWNANLMQLGNVIDVFSARHVSGTYTPIIRSIRCWVATYGFLHRVFVMDGGLESRTVHTTNTAALKSTTHPKTRCRKPYVATQHLMLLMMGVYVPETCQAKNTSITLPSCIKLAFHFISYPVLFQNISCRFQLPDPPPPPPFIYIIFFFNFISGGRGWGCRYTRLSYY